MYLISFLHDLLEDLGWRRQRVRFADNTHCLQRDRQWHGYERAFSKLGGPSADLDFGVDVEVLVLRLPPQLLKHQAFKIGYTFGIVFPLYLDGDDKALDTNQPKASPRAILDKF